MSNPYSFTLNSVDYGDSDHGVRVLNDSFPVIPQPRVDVQPLGGADGAATQGAHYEALMFNLECIVKANSLSDLRTKIGQINTDLKACHTAGEVSFILDHYPNWQWTVRWTGISPIRIRGRTAVQFTLTLVATDPDYTVV